MAFWFLVICVAGCIWRCMRLRQRMEWFIMGRFKEDAFGGQVWGSYLRTGFFAPTKVVIKPHNLMHLMVGPICNGYYDGGSNVKLAATITLFLLCFIYFLPFRRMVFIFGMNRISSVCNRWVGLPRVTKFSLKRI
jgi:hypothetical protein